MAYFTLSTTSKPTTAQVQQWLNDAEDQITAALTSVGITAPGATAAGYSYLKRQAVDYAVAQTRQVRAAANGGDPADDYAEQLLVQFDAFIRSVETQSEIWSGRLEGGAAGADSLLISGTATNDLDGRAVTHSSMKPTFTRSTEI